MSATSSPDSVHPTSPFTLTSTPPADLRHMTSNNVLITPGKDRDHKSPSRHSQHLQTSSARLGSRSPSSIPSSPTSIHSSSSAIFERDIEPLSPSPPHPHHPPNPHRIPRSKTTEQIEQSVPSVLDSAAAILAGLDEDDQISVVAPANLDAVRSRSSGFASPIGSFRSRSPSPLGNRGAGSGANRTSLLLSIPHPNNHAQPPSGVSGSVHVATPIPSPYSPASATTPVTNGVSIRPSIQTQVTATTVNPNSTPPSIITPTSAYFSTTSSVPSTESSPTTTTREHPIHGLPASPPTSSPPTSSPPTSSPPTHVIHPHPISPSSLSHPPSPTHSATKRLSFMSYSDLLSSTPASTLPLSSLTTSASSIEPPPHIPSVAGLTQAPIQSASAATSLRGFVIGGGGSNIRDRDSIAMLDDVGGEWEREGLGRGLEERLEALMPVQSKA